MLLVCVCVFQRERVTEWRPVSLWLTHWKRWGREREAEKEGEGERGESWWKDKRRRRRRSPAVWSNDDDASQDVLLGGLMKPDWSNLLPLSQDSLKHGLVRPWDQSHPHYLNALPVSLRTQIHPEHTYTLTCMCSHVCTRSVTDDVSSLQNLRLNLTP